MNTDYITDVARQFAQTYANKAYLREHLISWKRQMTRDKINPQDVCGVFAGLIDDLESKVRRGQDYCCLSANEDENYGVILYNTIDYVYALVGYIQGNTTIKEVMNAYDMQTVSYDEYITLLRGKEF